MRDIYHLNAMKRLERITAEWILMNCYPTYYLAVIEFDLFKATYVVLFTSGEIHSHYFISRQTFASKFSFN